MNKTVLAVLIVLGMFSAGCSVIPGVAATDNSATVSLTVVDHQLLKNDE